ncbi:MAG: TetR/AcrR family transcriptional regulator [Bradymonadaceae bacterium]|nr:TetR/AcrR family transcriptional regulator [Lujinxingiaceae bacterium]
MASKDEKTRRGPGRPRDPAHDRAIREAIVELLSERGFGGLTMNDVAERAGVAKTTMYRRWPSKAAMVLDAIVEELEPPAAVASDDALDDLRRFIVGFYELLAGGAGGVLPIAPAMLLREGEFAAAFGERVLVLWRDLASALVERALRQGRLRAGVDASTLVDVLVALAVYYPVALGKQASTQLAERVFALVVAGAGQ